MSDSPYFLDACVPMYAIGRNHPYHEACARIMVATSEGWLEAVTDSEVIQEIAYRFHSIQRRADGLVLAAQFLEAIGDHGVLSVTRRDIVRALELLRDHAFLLPRDAVHIAVMQAAGVSRVVTADRHFEGVPGVERVDPRDLTW